MLHFKAHGLCAYSMRVYVMSRIYDEAALKKSVNLSINSDLLGKARSLKINLSAALEHSLVLQVKAATRNTWLSKNKKALETLNDLADKNGLFSDAYRKF